NLDLLPLDESFLRKADEVLSAYEKKEIDWQLEKSLRQRNDFLVSFAVSKAENSALTLAEAEEVYNLITNETSGKDYAFLRRKLDKGEKLTQKDHDRLEYFNIAKTFRSLNESGIKLKELTPELIAGLHQKLTAGLDIFSDHLDKFETYHSGCFRSDDQTRVADFTPAPYQEIAPSIQELIVWIKKNPSALNIFIFHAALYALHPFKNGNKRVCRVLEHFLLQDIGYNQKNLYSPSYYYHKHKNKYYKNLIEALYKHNFNYFVAFASEALFFSIIGVVAGVLQRSKTEFLDASGLDNNVIKTLKPLVKYSEVRFTRLYSLSKRKASRQTFVNYLAIAVDSGVLLKREQGKNTYYSLAGNYPEEVFLADWLDQSRKRFNFLPEEFINYASKS
ncbi:MAG: Fic family protein, partial [Candidatus Falkowbacteria bacterium]